MANQASGAVRGISQVSTTGAAGIADREGVGEVYRSGRHQRGQLRPCEQSSTGTDHLAVRQTLTTLDQPAGHLEQHPCGIGRLPGVGQVHHQLLVQATSTRLPQVVVGQAQGGPGRDPVERPVRAESDHLHASRSRVVATGTALNGAEKAFQMFDEVRHGLDHRGRGISVVTRPRDLRNAAMVRSRGVAPSYETSLSAVTTNVRRAAG